MNESELLAAIAADPTDVDPYLVYADWLTERGDPRGELIALQAELTRTPEPAEELRAAADRLAREVLFECATLIAEGVLSIEWRYGFVRAARFAGTWNVDVFGPRRRDEYLSALLAHPCSRMIEAIEIGDWWVERDRVFDADAAALARAPKSLRSAAIVPRGEHDVSGRVYGLASFFRAHPQLVELSVAGESVGLPARIDLPALESLSILEHQPAEWSITSILTNDWPSLRHISITSSGRPYSAVAALPSRGVYGNNFPKLESVSLHGALEADMFVLDAIARLPLLSRLKRLELVRCGIDDAGAGVLYEHRDAFAHLELLNLEDNHLTPDGVSMVEALPCPVRL